MIGDGFRAVELAAVGVAVIGALDEAGLSELEKLTIIGGLYFVQRRAFVRKYGEEAAEQAEKVFGYASDMSTDLLG